MTAQAAEILFMEGRAERLVSLPLEPWMDSQPAFDRSVFARRSTGLYRGYLGLWELHDAQLYLIGLADGDGHPIDPACVFPGQAWPVPARWFSGRLDLDRGERLAYWHQNWMSNHEVRLRLYFDQGRLLKRRRFDHARLFRRQVLSACGGLEPLRQCLMAERQRELGPVGGFTAAGLRVLGLDDCADVEAWPADDDDEPPDGLVEYRLKLLVDCGSPVAGGATAAARDAAVRAGRLRGSRPD